MIKSMTGYGRFEGVIEGRQITVEIKSVNHRYFEFSSRITRGYGFLEERLKGYLQERVARGKVDAYVSIETLEDAEAQVQVNHSLAAGYVNALHELAQRYNLRDDLSVSTLSRYSEIFSVHKAPEDEDAIWRIVQQGADFAMESFLAMREREGQRPGAVHRGLPRLAPRRGDGHEVAHDEPHAHEHRDGQHGVERRERAARDGQALVGPGELQQPHDGILRS